MTADMLIDSSHPCFVKAVRNPVKGTDARRARVGRT